MLCYRNFARWVVWRCRPYTLRTRWGWPHECGRLCPAGPALTMLNADLLQIIAILWSIKIRLTDSRPYISLNVRILLWHRQNHTHCSVTVCEIHCWLCYSTNHNSARCHLGCLLSRQVHSVNGSVEGCLMTYVQRHTIPTPNLPYY